MSGEVTLFDLPSKGKNACWSLNPWKTRFALNFKGVPYKTEWIEYPDIKPTFKSYGIPSNDLNAADVTAEYSIPTVRLPDGTYIMDSMPIALALEKQYPTPSLRLDNSYTERVQKLIVKTRTAIAPEAMPKVPRNLLNEESAKYFEETRAKRFGMPLAELGKSEKAGETAWKAVASAMDEAKALLAEHPEGPYVEGNEVSYADFVLAGFWQFLRRIDEKGLYEETLKRNDSDGSLRKQFEACWKWMERDDH
ncbi:hypothetical protein K431DRAFT_299380 [Polychaeton citri CBS 116435]|uniref:GST N-terminal domain-containing protein n=1 Tax=Polychaeton citri CBS 116435 TaxID=1314669 RepID=A0A9P4QJY5_9PEZI|nr:hypothetical protein K431DRAFT_299380 [Polychaeton citri CBS 116435]